MIRVISGIMIAVIILSLAYMFIADLTGIETLG